MEMNKPIHLMRRVGNTMAEIDHDVEAPLVKIFVVKGSH